MKEKKIADLLQENKGSWIEEYVISNAPTLMAIFANFVVLIAEVRVYDVMYNLTGSWWKALSASFACAVPFILWEVAWQYNHTTDSWRTASLAMAGLAFVTSILLGVADFLNFTGEYWSNFLLGGVVVLTGIHTVVGFLYYYNDPDVARKRRKAQALAAMADHETNAQVAESLLQSGSTLMNAIRQLEGQYSPEEVEAMLNILRGKQQKDAPTSKRGQQPQRPPAQLAPARTFAKDTEAVESPTKAERGS